MGNGQAKQKEQAAAEQRAAMEADLEQMRQEKEEMQVQLKLKSMSLAELWYDAIHLGHLNGVQYASGHELRRRSNCHGQYQELKARLELEHELAGDIISDMKKMEGYLNLNEEQEMQLESVEWKHELVGNIISDMKKMEVFEASFLSSDDDITFNPKYEDGNEVPPKYPTYPMKTDESFYQVMAAAYTGKTQSNRALLQAFSEHAIKAMPTWQDAHIDNIEQAVNRHSQIEITVGKPVDLKESTAIFKESSKPIKQRSWF